MDKSIKQEILDRLADGQITAAELMSMPYCRRTIQIHMKELVESGKVFRFGLGKKTVYSLDNVQKFFPKKKEAELVLPDMPPLMLHWLGYTNKIPDPEHGYIVHGGQWT